MSKELKNEAIAIFAGKQIRRHWDEEEKLWYFAVVDIVKAIIYSPIPRRYWSGLKNKGSEVYEKIVQMKPLQNATLYNNESNFLSIGILLTIYK